MCVSLIFLKLDGNYPDVLFINY